MRVKYFNTAGPCDPELHYMLPAGPRLPQARELIEMDRYFVVHAPRQTGKTTTLGVLELELRAEGSAVALTVSCEAASVAGDDFGAAELVLLDDLREAARSAGLEGAELPPEPWPEAAPGARLGAALSAWAARCPRPLVLFFDEIDAMRGQSLLSVLRQLRNGHNMRPKRHPFPNAVALCGLRDVRDYKAASGGEPSRLGTASPFNISVRSLRMGDFTCEEVAGLYAQHTAATGQEFRPEAVARAFEVTCGQPWLVNALAYEITREMRIPPEDPITAEHVDQARERLIRARATHLDSLVAKLQEPRVRRVMEPMIAGTFSYADDTFDDDVSYVRDLGLIAQGLPLRVANPIYREVVLRVLGGPAESFVLAEPRSFVLPDGRFDLPRLLREFTGFWREHGEVLVRGTVYHEAACHIVLMAYLQRLVNGGGYLDREYATGTGRLDVLIRWPYQGPDGDRRVQREALEVKLWHPGRPDPHDQGLEQLDGYLDRLGLDTGVLVVFDRRPQAPAWHERTTLGSAATPRGRKVTVLRA
ncbi:ATP-binding protein [Actinocorallia herbida]|uniref:ATP-binding protein n=1 Tax=Actinocorallia herbida TaxID=58109 RepID=UPI001B85F139|nr:ATP-binding protein [Actinocorallia herbida]